MKQKYELEPTDSQHHILNFTSKACNLVANALFDAYQGALGTKEWETSPPNLNILFKGIAFETRGKYPGIFEGVDLTAIKYTCCCFLIGVSDGKKIEGVSNDFKYQTYGSRVKIEHGRIHLPKVGRVQLVGISNNTKVENLGIVTVSKKNNKWFIEFES